MEVTPETLDTLTRSAVPGPGDLLEAREVILETLSDGGSHHERDLNAALLARKQIPEYADRNEHIVQTWTDDGWTLPTGDEPGLARLRLTGAVRQALAALVREQVVGPAEGNIHGAPDTSVNFQQVRGGTATGSVRISRVIDQLPNQATDCRWRLLADANSPRTQLARQPLVDSLDDLLGTRGLEVLNEAVACFHVGRFIAAVDLLAAASEAAWFGIGAAAGGHDTKLDRLVAAGDGSAEVIQRTAGVIASQKALPRAVQHDVLAQAVRLRDLRNYGLHPVGTPDETREGAFTEAGAAALFMTARRYFGQLEVARNYFAGPP